MERGMGIRASLDPQAEEFYPSCNFALAAPAPQFYIPYPHGPHPQPQPQAQYVAPAQLVEDGAVTRAVVLSMVPRGVSPDVVRAAMEEFGGVRAVEMGALAGEGNVTVHFYDLRSAQTAVAEIREQHLRQQCRLGQQYGVMPGGWAGEQGGGVVYLMVGGGRGLIGGQAVWAHFTSKELDGPNQGSLTILNAGQGLSMDAVRQVFEDFGGVKEVREGAAHGQQKKVVVVEFFDTRDAARALSELRGKQVLGVQLVIQFNKSKSSHQRRRSGGVQSLPLPPRLLGKTTATNTSQSQLWSQSKGRGGADGGGGGDQGIIGLMKRTSSSGSSSSSITTNSNSGGMRRSGKNSSSCNSSSSNCSRNNNNNNNNNSSSASSSSFKQQRNWKNHNQGMKNEDSMFLFKEELETMESSPSCRDSRTTVMIKNIPNKYSQKLLLNMLDNHCIHCNEQIGGEGEEPMSAYDFVYLPIDFNNKCNVGYGFVNLTSPEAAWRLYKAFHMQPWEVFNSRKICQVTYARLQGLEALKDHFKSSKFACDDDEYMPVSFSPPRDGKQLTDPTPIGSRSVVGIQQTRANANANANAAAAASSRCNSSSTTTKASSSADDDECPDTATMLSEALRDLSSITQD